MKSVEKVIDSIRTQLEDRWDAELIDPTWWPRSYPLGNVTSSAAAAISRELRDWIFDWHDFIADQGGPEQGLELTWRRRKIGRHGEQRDERLPTHLTISTIDAAARIVGSPWPSKLRVARSRLKVLQSRFPESTTARMLRLAQPLSQVDFDLAQVAAQWFAEHEPAAWEHLTPRQVPIEGLHGKWLNGHRRLVQGLAGLDSLKLSERPTRIYFTYLDPDYRRPRRRVHDSYTIGDHHEPYYYPRIVVINENKDTAFLFPELADAISVEGNGNASVGLLPQVDWIKHATEVFYWGDMDARGYEIVDGLRRKIRVRTILMDWADYECYERFGTNIEPNGKPIKLRTRLELPELTEAEREVYNNLTDPDWDRYLRVEQERIPLEVALARVTSD